MDEKLREKLLKTMVDEGVLRESDKPIFFLKSGYRTSYFFDLDRLTHNPKTVPLLEQILSDEVSKLQLEAKSEGIRITKLILFEKSYGETSGTEPLVSSIAHKTGLEAVTLPSPILYPYKDRVKGMPVQEGEFALVIDDIVTTGRGLLSNIRRFERITKARVYASIPIVHRAIGALTTEQKILPIFERKDFIKSGIWKPEILKLTFDSSLWPGIDMNRDYLMEICEFTGITEKYYKFRGKMMDLFAANYKTIPLSEDETVRYLVNIQILIWNYVRASLFKDVTLEGEEIVEYLEDFLSIELVKVLTIDVLANIMNKELLSSSNIEVEALHDLFVKKQKEIVAGINNKLRKVKERRMKRVMTREEATEMVDKIVHRTHKTTVTLADKYNLDLGKLEESDKIMREGLWELLKKHYTICEK